MFRTSCIVVALVLAVGVGGIGQQSQIPGTFRTAITLVPIDVRVLDHDNKPVTDLKQGDFTVYEDGVRQDIRHFSASALTPEAAPSDPRLPLRKPPASTIAAQNRRVFLIVLGRGRLGQPPDGGMSALSEFVRKRLLPQDHVAVMAYNRATDFTTDHEKVAQVLDRYGVANYQLDLQMAHWFSGLTAMYGSRTPPPEIQKQIDDVFQTPIIGSRYVPPMQTAENPRRLADMQRTAEALQQTEIINNRAIESPFDKALLADLSRYINDEELDFGYYVSASVQTLQDVDSLFAGIEYLRYFEGEKHLIFMTSHGLFLPRVEDDDGIAAVANDARVVIDSIFAGIPSPTPVFENMNNLGTYQPRTVPGPSTTQFFAMSSVENVSELTGGRAFKAMYTRDAVKRIDVATQFGYLLGYYPTNPAPDGRYRKISVTVNRPGVKVLFRHGYYSRDVLVPTDRKAFVTYSRVAAAAGFDRPIKDIGVTINAVSVARPAPGSLAADIDTSIRVPLSCFTEEGDRHVTSLAVSIFLADAKETLVGEIWQTIDLKLKPETFERVLKDGLPYTARVPLTAPARWVKVVVYEPTADIAGSAVRTVQK